MKRRARSTKAVRNAVVRVDCVSVRYNLREPWRSSSDSADEERGSGWCIKLPLVEQGVNDKPQGYSFIATCYHCIKDAMQISLRAPPLGPTNVPAYVAIAAPFVDAAILCVRDQCSELVALDCGDDKLLDVGDELIVYGFPGGQTNMKEVVSRLNGREDGMLQIDGAINPGDSGGPVISVKTGKVVGWIKAGTPANNNVAYAMPITNMLAILSECNHVLRARANNHYYHNGTDNDHDDTDNGDSIRDDLNVLPNTTILLREHSLGVDYYAATDALFEALEIDPEQNGSSGVVVRWMSRLSPLRAAGAEIGDVLLRITLPIALGLRGGKYSESETMEFTIDNDGLCDVPWTNGERYDLIDIVRSCPLGSECTVDTWSVPQNRQVSYTVKLQDMALNGLRQEYAPYSVPGYRVYAGIVFMQLSKGVTKEFPESTTGKLTKSELEDPWLVVVNVLPGSPLAPLGDAHQTPISPGDVVIAVNGIATRTLSQLRRALEMPIAGAYFHLVVHGNFSVTYRSSTMEEADESLAELYGYPRNSGSNNNNGSDSDSHERDGTRNDSSSSSSSSSLEDSSDLAGSRSVSATSSSISFTLLEKDDDVRGEERNDDDDGEDDDERLDSDTLYPKSLSHGDENSDDDSSDKDDDRQQKDRDDPEEETIEEHSGRESTV